MLVTVFIAWIFSNFQPYNQVDLSPRLHVSAPPDLGAVRALTAYATKNNSP